MRETPTDLGYPADAELVGPTGVASIPAAFQRTIARFPDAVAMRTVDDSTRLTWSQAADEVERLAASFAALEVGDSDTVALMLTNRPEHQLCDLAILHLGGAATSIYNSLPAGDVNYAVSDSRAKVMVVEEAFESVVRDGVTHYGLSIEHLVVLDNAAPAELPGVRVWNYAEFRSLDAPCGFDFEKSWRAVKREDLALVIYTSGTTGPPKGVELSHSNLLQCADVYREVAPLRPGRRLLSAFPLAHVAERVGTYYVTVLQGHCVTFCPDLRQLNDYYLAVRPAYVFLTPRSLERFRSVIDRAIALEENTGRRQAMERAVRLGVEVVTAEQNEEPVDPALRKQREDTADVRRELLAIVGLDSVEFALVGSAPVSRELMIYFLGLGLPAREGWAMTESGATGAIGRLHGRQRVGYAGPPTPGNEIKLAEDGEILVRGAGVMVRYRNKPEQTRAAIDEDGWLHSGDIGELSEDGQLRMVDRKKELIINANGKNMSPINIESKIKVAGSLIGHVVAVGDSRPYVTALLTLDTEGLALFRHRHEIDPSVPAADLVDDSRVRKEVTAQIEAGNAELSDVEKIRGWALLPGEWMPGGDELTPSMKLRRRAIITKYSKEIDGLYERS